MYLDNKYTKWYNSIINKASNRTTTGYTEKHHIIPSSLGGTNDKENLVQLTAKEHFICHLLLTKMVEGNNKRKMTYAVWLLCNVRNHNQPDRYIPNSRVYQSIRKQYAINISENQRGIKKTYSSFGGKKHSPESIKKQREAKLGCKNPNFGISQKPEWNKKKSDSQKGILKPLILCEHCGKSVGGHGNYFRWHGTKCKLNKLL